MRFLALFLAGLLALAGPGAAQQIKVLSGEHDGFSRLVFMLPAGTDWATERVEGGYRLSTGTPQRFDLADVFRLIPKTRVRAVTADPDMRSVLIETGPEVHLETTRLPIGAVVLDIVDGADQTPIAAPAEAPPAEAAIAVPPPARSYRPAPRLSYLDLYWGGGPAAQPPAQAEAIPEAASAPPADVPQDASSRIALPDGRISAAELALIDQLSRAASQGLITMQIPQRDLTARHDALKAAEQKAGHSHEHADETDSEMAAEPDAAPAVPEAAPATMPEETLALQSETVIDRDMSVTFEAGRLAEAGHSCPPDRDYDLQAWRNEDPPAQQIADARRDLLEEFDKPRVQALEYLAKVYISLGFGAEARALFPSFGLETPARLEMLANLVENRPTPPRPEFAAQITCNSKSALWALIALPEPPAKALVNFGAVVRAYAALPPDVRNQIGPALSARLIETGAPDVAETVRSMLARAPVDTRVSLDVIDARIDLSRGESAAATERLDTVARTGTELAAEALALSIETKLAEGMAISQSDVENAGALSFQLSGSPLGGKLARAAILGHGSTGQFDEAFLQFDEWKAPDDAALRARTRNDLMQMVAKVPDDTLFVEAFFRHRADWSPEQLDAPLQVALANRLTEVGFWISARAVIAPETRGTPAGRLALARAALAGNDAAAAYSHVIGLEGEDAAQLRGAALSKLGQHEGAEAAFAEAGDIKAQTEAAWRAGNLSKVADSGSETQRRFIELFADLDAAQDPPAPAAGPLAAAADLLERSAAEREAFSRLMDDLREK